MKSFIGCDPGLRGAIAIVNERAELISCFDMPVREIRGVKTATVKNEVNPSELVAQLDPGPLYDLEYGIIERVGTRPRQGIASAFGFGDSFGAARSVLECACAGRIGEARPADWKRDLGLETLDKDASIEKAKKLVSGSEQFLTRKKDHDRAEAILLAWMALKRWKNGKR